MTVTTSTAQRGELHPRVTVVLTPPDAEAGLALGLHELVRPADLDLRGGVRGPIDAAVVRAIALARAAELRGQRELEYETARSRVEADVAAATAGHEKAAAFLAELQFQQERLLTGARWCDDERGTAARHRAAVAEAEQRLETARRAAAHAAQRVDRLAEQRAAATPILESARAELAALEAADLGEPALRRQLEEAVEHARRCEGRLADALQELRAAERALESAGATRDDEIDGIGQAAPPEVVAAVRRALEGVDGVRQAPPDARAVALSEALAAAEAEVARITVLVEEAESSVRGAEGRLEHARELRQELDSKTAMEPQRVGWWEQLGRLHDEVEAAEAALGGRGKNAAQKRHDAALAAERALLDELGFASYLDAALSGGRLPGSCSAAEAAELRRRRATAEEAVADAEREVEATRRRLASLREFKAPAEDLVQLRREAEQLLGRPVGPGTVYELAELRPGSQAAIDELRAALAAAAVDTPGDPADAARLWLEAQAAGEERRAALQAEEAGAHAELRAELQRCREQLADAQAETDRARASVEHLELEMHERVRQSKVPTDPAERAATVQKMREHIEALEARLESAREEIEDAVRAAADELSAATDERDEAQRAAQGIAQQAARLAALLPVDRRPAPDSVELEALAGLLRYHAAELHGSEPAAEAAMGAADISLLAAVNARDALRPLPPVGEPAEGDIIDAFRELLAQSTGSAPVVVAGPGPSLSATARTAVLDLLLETSERVPVVLVSADPEVASWAIELPSHVGTAVPHQTFRSDLAKQVDRAAVDH